MVLDPLAERAPLARVGGPPGGDQPGLPWAIEGDAAPAVKDLRVHGIVQDHRPDGPIPHLDDLLVRPGRLDHRGRGEPGIETETEFVLLAVEAPGQGDRPVDAVYDPEAMLLPEGEEPVHVEVDGIEEV